MDIRVAAEQARVARYELTQQQKSGYLTRAVTAIDAALASLGAALAAQPEQQQGQGLVHPAMSTSGRTSMEGGAFSKVRELRDVQARDGNWNFDPYMQGLHNGLELALAVVEDREPVFKSAPVDGWRGGLVARGLDGSPVRTDDGQMNQKESHD